MTANGLKNDALAKSVGVSQPTVSNWINGRFEPGAKQLKKLSEVTGTDIFYLLRLIEILPPSGESGEAEMRPKVLAVLRELETLPDEILDLLADQIKHVLRPRSKVFKGEIKPDAQPTPDRDVDADSGDAGRGE